MDEWMYGWMEFGLMNVWVGGCMDRWVAVWIDGWIDGWLYG